VNLFLIGVVMHRDSRLLTSKCEVFPPRFGCQYKNMCHLLELLTVLCTDAAIFTGGVPRVPGKLEGISVKYVSKCRFCLLPEVLSVSCS
jgi:hypothetical protein